jgi:phosphinothricin acetyltransferase
MNARCSINLRQASTADAGDLCRIYNREVEQSTVTLDLVPRSLDEQRAYITDRSGGLAIVVAEIDDAVVGFASLSFYRDRPGYRTSVEDSVYVDRDHHGRGLGSALLGEVVRLATNHGFHTIFARVIGPQEASVALHERHGFALVGIERQVGRKFGRWHDVALLQRML